MSTFSQNPDPYGAEAALHGDRGRLSILAVIALVCSLIGCIPIVGMPLGILAVILGIAALILIGSSHGRLRGTGLSVAALIIGLITAAIWGAVMIGMVSVISQFKTEGIERAAAIAQAVEASDIDTIKSKLPTEFAEKITPERVEAFRSGYHDELGKFVGISTGLMDILKDYAEIATQLEQLGQKSGNENVMPFPARFENGMAMVLIRIDESAGTQLPGGGHAGNLFAIENIGITTPDGTELWLIQPEVVIPDSGTPPDAEPPSEPPVPTGDGG
jgi:hypothetical protein